MPMMKKVKKLSKREKDDKKTPRKRRTFVMRKKKCRFCTDKIAKIEYLDHQLLGRFITDRGKIVPSRISGTCARHQRKLAKVIKRARNIGLLPFLVQ